MLITARLTLWHVLLSSHRWCRWHWGQLYPMHWVIWWFTRLTRVWTIILVTNRLITIVWQYVSLVWWSIQYLPFSSIYTTILGGDKIGPGLWCYSSDLSQVVVEIHRHAVTYLVRSPILCNFVIEIIVTALALLHHWSTLGFNTQSCTRQLISEGSAH